MVVSGAGGGAAALKLSRCRRSRSKWIMARVSKDFQSNATMIWVRLTNSSTAFSSHSISVQPGTSHCRKSISSEAGLVTASFAPATLASTATLLAATQSAQSVTFAALLQSSSSQQTMAAAQSGHPSSLSSCSCCSSPWGPVLSSQCSSVQQMMTVLLQIASLLECAVPEPLLDEAPSWQHGVGSELACRGRFALGERERDDRAAVEDSDDVALRLLPGLDADSSLPAAIPDLVEDRRRESSD